MGGMIIEKQVRDFLDGRRPATETNNNSFEWVEQKLVFRYYNSIVAVKDGLTLFVWEKGRSMSISRRINMVTSLGLCYGCKVFEGISQDKLKDFVKGYCTKEDLMK